jgi:hypothetical protein
MSKSIDKVKVQIPGTMYHLQLAEDRGRWILGLLLKGVVEKEVIVPVLSKNGIVKAANEILNDSRLVIDKYPLRIVCDKLYSAAETSLPTSQTLPEEEIIDTTEIDGLKQKIDLLENTLENTTEELKHTLDDFVERLDSLENDRVARLESEITKDDDKNEEEILTNLSDRISNLEESIVESKGDERIPSILSALDAIESKIKEIEGKQVVHEAAAAPAPATEGVGSIGGLKEELARITQAFDKINQRLTDIESKLRGSESQPVEGAPPSPPTV